MSYCFTVGMKGFEPSTTWSQTRHSNRTELHPETFDLTSDNYDQTDTFSKAAAKIALLFG